MSGRRRCLSCATIILSGSRCAPCQRRYRPDYGEFRRAVLAAAGYRCASCGLYDPTGRTLDADHIVPLADGGTNHAANGQALCLRCHAAKTRQEAAR